MMTHRLIGAALLLIVSGAIAQPPRATVTFKGHTDPIYTVALSPDGQQLATGSFDKTIRLWNPTSGQTLRLLAGKGGHQNQVLQLTFSPRGNLLASGGSDNSVKLWEIDNRLPSRTLKHDSAITQLALSADGKSLAAAGADGVIKTWTVADGKPGPNLPTGGPIVGLNFGNNANQLSSLNADRTLRHWTLPAGTTTGPVGVAASELAGFAVYPGNSQAIIATSDGVLSLFPANLTAAKPLTPSASAITLMSLSNDGQLAILGQADKSARVINITNGQETQLFKGLGSDLKSVTMASNNQLFAVGTADGKVHLFGGDGKPRIVFATGDKSVTDLQITPNQQQLVTTGPDGTVKIWGVPGTPRKSGTADPKPVATIKAGSPVVRLAFLPNGQLLTSGTDKSLKLWDVASQKELKSFPALPAVASSLSLSRDGSQAVLAMGKQLRLVTLADGKQTPLPDQPAEVLSVGLSPDKSKVVLGLGNNSCRVIDATSGKLLQFSTTGGPVTGVAYHPSQPWFVSASSDKSIVVNTLALTKQVVDPTLGRLLGIASNGSQLFTGGVGKGMAIWNAGNLSKERTLDLEGPIRAVCSSKNGQQLALSHGPAPLIDLLNSGDGKLLGSLKPEAPAKLMAFHPTLPILFTLLENNKLLSWAIPIEGGKPLEPEFGKPLQEFPHPAAVSDLVVAPDGQSLLTGSVDKELRFWSIISDQPIKNLGHPNLVDCVAFSPNGEQLATGCHDGILRVFDVAKGTAVKTINAHNKPQVDPIYAVIWTPDGKQILTASFDKTIKFWDADKGTMIREIRAGYDRFPPDPQVAKYSPAIIGALGSGWLNAPPDEGHRDQVFTLAISPDGKLLASGSSDRTVKLWDLATGLLVRDFPNPTFKTPPPGLQAQSHPGFVHQVRFNRSGTKLISVGTAPRGQGYLAIWNVADGKLLGGYDLPVGPIYSFEIVPEGVILGCGAKQRFQSESEAVLIPLPVK